MNLTTGSRFVHVRFVHGIIILDRWHLVLCKINILINSSVFSCKEVCWILPASELMVLEMHQSHGSISNCTLLYKAQHIYADQNLKKSHLLKNISHKWIKMKKKKKWQFEVLYSLPVFLKMKDWFGSMFTFISI